MSRNHPAIVSEPQEEKPPRLPLKERFVWLWHPHFWLTTAVVIIVILGLVYLAK